MRFSKYHSKKVTVSGITFDSKKEGMRYMYLRQLERKGEIKDLKLQVPYVLVPLQKLSEPRPHQKSERPVKYIADFVYTQNGQTIVEDTKGMKTPEYIIKRKLMKYIYGIEIKEV